jgi:hypothetical protein
VLLRCLTSKLQHQSNTLDNLQDPLKPSLAVTISKTGIMSTSTQTCKFFDLPPELRNHIYELVLLDTDVEYVVDNWDWEFPSLLHVCTQIRSEALGLYYSRTMFYLCCKSEILRDVLIGLTNKGPICGSNSFLYTIVLVARTF